MNEFDNHIEQLRTDTQSWEHVDIKDSIDQIEQIGQQVQSSQKFLLKEIQLLKANLERNSTKLKYANELRAIDQITLRKFQTKLQDLTDIIASVKEKELNAWHLMQILRVNISRLWHLFETTTGSTISQELIYEDLQKLVDLAEKEKTEQRSCLTLLEKEHGDVLIKMKDIQLSLEHFRTLILQTTQTITEMQFQTSNQQQINDRTHEQVTKRLNHLVINIKDIQALLIDYKSIVNEIAYLLKLIFHVQTEIELHHKSTLLYHIKLDKCKEDLTFVRSNRTARQTQIGNLQKQIERQNENVPYVESQQRQIMQYRQHLHQHIERFELEKTEIITQQHQLLQRIQETTKKNHALQKGIYRSHQTIKDAQQSCRKLIREHHKQEDRTTHLHRTVETNQRQVQMITRETDQYIDQIKQQDDQITSKEVLIDIHTKEYHDLETCLSLTYEELNNYRTKVNQSQTRVQSLTQTMHKYQTDQKPLTKEISRYQQQIARNERNHNQIELNFKQTQTRIHQYKSILDKLVVNSKTNDRILQREKLVLQRYHHQTERSKNNSKDLVKHLKYSEEKYLNLKQIFHFVTHENQELKRQYSDLTFLGQLLGQRQTLSNNALKPLYDQLNLLINQHHENVTNASQSKVDLNILQKYYRYLRSYNHRLHQSQLFEPQQRVEYLNSQSISNQLTHFQKQLKLEMKKPSNHIHYWHSLMISSPEKYDQIAKLFLIKKKLVEKWNELEYLKKIFQKKKSLYHYLSQIYNRRQKLMRDN